MGAIIITSLQRGHYENKLVNVYRALQTGPGTQEVYNKCNRMMTVMEMTMMMVVVMMAMVVSVVDHTISSVVGL